MSFNRWTSFMYRCGKEKRWWRHWIFGNVSNCWFGWIMEDSFMYWFCMGILNIFSYFKTINNNTCKNNYSFLLFILTNSFDRCLWDTGNSQHNSLIFFLSDSAQVRFSPKWRDDSHIQPFQSNALLFLLDPILENYCFEHIANDWIFVKNHIKNTLFWGNFGEIDRTVRLALVNKRDTDSVFSDLFMSSWISIMKCNKWIPPNPYSREHFRKCEEGRLRSVVG